MALQNVSADVSIPEALLHTIISMSIVFSVLILISFIIYLLKFIPALLSGERKKKDEKTAPVKVEEKTEPSAARETPAPSEDAQLVAVIAAAVAAGMEEETGVPVSPDGLVIRSIKKRTFSI